MGSNICLLTTKQIKTSTFAQILKRSQGIAYMMHLFKNFCIKDYNICIKHLYNEYLFIIIEHGNKKNIRTVGTGYSRNSEREMESCTTLYRPLYSHLYSSPLPTLSVKSLKTQKRDSQPSRSGVSISHSINPFSSLAL